MGDRRTAVVIGCGAAGGIHARELAGRGFRVRCYDEDGGKAAGLAKAVGGVAVEDPGAEEADIAVVAVPASGHIGIARRELGRGDGRAVVVEKPLGLPVAETAAWAREVVGAGLPLYVAESSGYGNDLEGWRERIRGGAFGRPVIWQAQFATTYRPQGWSYDLEVGGGAFLEGGVHMLTVGRLLFGEAVKWSGAVRCLGGGTGPDTGTLLVEYAEGDMLALTLAWGTEGFFAGGGVVPPSSSWVIGPVRAAPLAVSNNHGKMWDALLVAIEGGEAAPCGIEVAAGAVEDCRRCYEAAGVGRSPGGEP